LVFGPLARRNFSEQPLERMLNEISPWRRAGFSAADWVCAEAGRRRKGRPAPKCL